MMETGKVVKFRGKILKISGVLLGVLLIAGALGFGRIMRLYRVVTLFEPDGIVENFRSMGETLDSRVIPAAARRSSSGAPKGLSPKITCSRAP